VFPRARDELAMQLTEVSQRETADWMRRSIHETLSLAELV
jgi:hypothetical protein